MKSVFDRGIVFLEPTTGSICYDRDLNAELCETLEEICSRKERPRIIVDLTNVYELHADGLGQLMVMYAETMSAGGTFALCGVNDAVHKYLAKTKAELILRYYKTRDHVHGALRDA